MPSNSQRSAPLQRLKRVIRKRLRQAGFGISNISPAERAKIVKRIESTALFNVEDYVGLHKDVASSGRDPLNHFAETGLREGRATLRPHGVARILHDLDQRHDADAASYLQEFESAQHDGTIEAFARSAKVVIAVHSHANYYMHPIAEALRHAVQSAGCDCQLVNETDASLAEAEFPIIVAPHEFFSMPGPAWLKERDFLSRAILFNTEQMASKWFAETLRWAYRSRAVIDVNFQTALAFGPAFPAAHILPPFDQEQLKATHATHDPTHPMFRATAETIYDWAPPRNLRERAIDLLFAGFKTPERDRFFTRNAPYLASKKCFISYSSLSNTTSVLTDMTRPIFSNNISVSRNSRIVLSIHRYSVGFFEWERMVAQGFSAGACVVSNRSLKSPFFLPNIHYFETISRNLDKIIRWILDTHEGMHAASKAVDDAHSVMSEQLTAQRVGRYLLYFLKSL